MKKGGPQGVPREKLADIIAELELHPESRRLYVEGKDDRTLLLWLLGCEHAPSMHVYQIDSVELRAPSSRKRVIMLAEELDREFQVNNSLKYVRCLVDRDFDELLGTGPSYSTLVFTDFSSMEMYGFEERVLDRVLKRGVGLPELDIPCLMESFSTVLRALFFTRTANIKLEWGLTWIDPSRKRYSLDSENNVKCDIECLQKDYLNSGGKASSAEQFRAVIETFEGISADIRRTIRGHDFIELLAWYIRKSDGTTASDMSSNAAWRLVRTAFQREELLEHPNLQALADLYAG